MNTFKGLTVQPRIVTMAEISDAISSRENRCLPGTRCMALITSEVHDDKNMIVVMSPDEQRMFERWQLGEARFYIYDTVNTHADPGLSAGDEIMVTANETDCEGTVLAVCGDVVMAEYRIPLSINSRGACAVRLQRYIEGEPRGIYYSMSHTAISKKWRRAMYEQGTRSWLGISLASEERVRFPGLPA